MTGLIELDSGIYAFRDDSGYGGIWAWNIHDDTGTGHVTTHKWPKIPKGGIITEFDIDQPPATVGYIPVLGDYL